MSLQTVIISGLPLSGKTRLLGWLNHVDQFKAYERLSVDEIRLALFGERKLSWSEHMLKNEVAWLRIKTIHLIEKRSVLHEVPMLNEDDYYKPVLKMVEDTNRYFRAIYDEQKSSGLIVCRETSLRVIHLFCEADVATERADQRRREVALHGNKSGTDVFDLATRKVGIMKMEFPTIFNPLFVDTSDESEEAVTSYRNDILDYLEGNDQNVVGEEYTKRLRKAKEAHEGLKKLVTAL